ncbi:MAG: hypothetical protein DRG11_05650 [Epsilonproteobacteria bacterium]|nr:MAG: hypothetical protein DRG11_05650 [Campylobacterota bacterium]
MKNTIIGMVIGIVIIVGGYFAYGFIKNIGNINTSSLPKYSVEYDKDANPHKDLKTAMDKAKKSGKNILLIAGGSWCHWCGAMDSFLKEHNDLQNSFYGDFEVLKVYYGNGINKDGQSLLKQLPVLEGTPHFYVLNSDAKLLKSFGTVSIEQGNSYNKKKFFEFIKQHKDIKK